MTRLFIVALIALIALPITPVSGQVEEPLDKVLKELDKRTAAIEDLTAAFTQEKHSILLRKPLVSKGRLWVLGDKVRWETTSPQRSHMLVTNKSAQLYDPKLNRVEIFPLSAGLAAIIGTPLPQFHRLKESFSIGRIETDDESALMALKLTPLDEKLAEHIESVTVWIDTKIPAATKLEMLDAEGDRTTITFSKVKLDQGLRLKDLALKLPADVTTEYPMGPLPDREGL